MIIPSNHCHQNPNQPSKKAIAFKCCIWEGFYQWCQVAFDSKARKDRSRRSRSHKLCYSLNPLAHHKNHKIYICQAYSDSLAYAPWDIFVCCKVVSGNRCSILPAFLWDCKSGTLLDKAPFGGMTHTQSWPMAKIYHREQLTHLEVERLNCAPCRIYNWVCCRLTASIRERCEGIWDDDSWGLILMRWT